MLTEKNFVDALNAMNFTAHGNRYEKIFADNVVMRADLGNKKLSYPAQIKGRERNNFFDAAHKENLVVFECVNRLLDKGYNPADIELEKQWQLGHSAKGGRADICVSSNGATLLIIECKTFGAEFNHERDNMLQDGGQLFSYWQQENSCQWLVLYASDFDGGELTFTAASVPCAEKFYHDAATVQEKFAMWRDRYEKKFLDDVIFHAETVAYKIGAKPLRKHDLKEFDDTSLVNRFEEILRHNQVSDKENAFNRLVALFICKLVDESLTPADGEVSFQFKDGSDTHEIFQDRLQRLYTDGMKKFMGEEIFYLPENYPDKLFENFGDEENHAQQISDLRENFRKLKFYTNNAFAFVDVNNDKLFYLNAKILKEVVDILRGYRIIGAKNLQTLGTMFEQLLDKGFKQNEGQFFTPTPIAQFIWDSLPLDRLIVDEPPKIIDYACGAGHFLTEGFRAVNDWYARKNLSPPVMWERDKLFGVEKDYRLARVSKISLFMHGANEGKIKFGDGLENYPDEKISPATFDILVANPPYSVKGFKLHLKLDNEENFTVLDKISASGSEIETLFAERIGQLVKPKGVAAVILPSSILNSNGKSFIAARESLLTKFFIRAIVELKGKTFGATSIATVVMFLERFDEPPKFTADFADVADSILDGKTLSRRFSREIFDGYLKKIGRTADAYREFIATADDKTRNDEREKILYFGLTFRQTTLIVSAPADNKEQEIFLGYGWSNAKGRKGMVIKKRGGLLFDNKDRAAPDRIAAVIRAAFAQDKVHVPALEKFYSYAALSDLLDFDAANFTKTIKTTLPRNVDVAPGMTLYNLGSADFDVSIGDRVLSTEIVDGGEVPVYSANVFEEFGRINKRNLTDFSKPSVIWGIDGDWMVNFIPANVPFYPTDHCGVLRVNTDKISAEYLAFVLRAEGEHAKFSRANRASIQRIKSLKVQLPPLDVQKEIVAEFNALDAQIAAQIDTIAQLDADIQTKFTALFKGKNFPRVKLGAIAPYVTERTTLAEISVADFVTTANMLKDKGGIKPYDGVPQISSVTKFLAGDVLVSNIAPSLKKVWLADRAGGCSPDVLVFRSSDEKILSAEYLFAVLKQDEFFAFATAHVKGMTIPRGDKSIIQRYEFDLPPLELQEEFAAYVANCEALKKSARARREELTTLRAALVEKYFR